MRNDVQPPLLIEYQEEGGWMGILFGNSIYFVEADMNSILWSNVNTFIIKVFYKMKENYNSKREDLEEEDQGEDERNVIL